MQIKYKKKAVKYINYKERTVLQKDVYGKLLKKYHLVTSKN